MDNLLTKQKKGSPRVITVSGPPSLSFSKEIIGETNRMASLENLVPSLSRAVVQTVRQCEAPAYVIDRDDVGLLVDSRWTADRHLPQVHGAPLEGRTFPRELVRRLIHVFREAESKEQVASIAASLKDWIDFQLSTVVQAPKSFVDHAQLLASHGHVDAALDLVFDRFDELLLAGEFDRVDQILDRIQPAAISVDLLVGILTVTLPAKVQLKMRGDFYDRVTMVLQNRGELQDGLLVGLE